MKRRDLRKRDKFEEPYKTCYLNGRKELVGNFRIEPPGLFRGRGAHPKTGKLKRRVAPEQVTLNLGKDAKFLNHQLAMNGEKLDTIMKLPG